METIDKFNGRTIATVEMDTDVAVIRFTDGTWLKVQALGDGSQNPLVSGAVLIIESETD